MKLKAALLTASMGAAAISGAASAQNVQYNAYGAGASLPANYVRQAADCYGVKTDLIFRGSTTPVEIADFVYTGSPAFDCSTDIVKSDAKISYISTGSGGGIQTFFSHDRTVPGDSNLDAAGVQNFATFTFALSETSLGQTEVNIYNNGGTNSTVTANVAAPGVTPGSGQYVNPNQAYGPMVQVPFLIAPVTIAFDPVYKKVRVAPGSGNAGDDLSIQEYSLNLYFTRADGSGGLRLDAAAVCAIFNGQITNWNDVALRRLNGNRSLQDPSDTGAFSVPLQIVGRQDSSGTSSLWTRYLANACEGTTGNSYNDSTSRIPGTYVDASGTTRTTTIAPGGSDLAGVVYLKANPNTAVSGEVLGTYTLADGNDGVAKYLDFTRVPTGVLGSTVVQGRIGYLGPDFALPAVLTTAANDFNLMTADVKNAAGNFRAPTSRNAANAYTVTPPQSNADGSFNAAGTGSRANPANWVEAASKTSAIANPTHNAAYPIVGTTNLLTYTCYKSNNNRVPLTGFMNWYFGSGTVNNPNLGLLTQSGFSPLPPAWRKAIRETFTYGTYPALSSLKIVTKGSATHCASSMIGG